ncbi:hypothetical protein HanXRQr2_Chr16g0755581 [Helianthus annuus]|nr:hypothetical protein HanXRQr2_Chr16g0755581 [Helianthus annuus]KAJ0443459.1 hypothetical protein HanIR_Chr16g0820991 [Helianthus annuus]KAJ0821769.1 hypothetical protein HanPSC8_Chr16g0724111 [Helianthus annuus]
MALRRHTPFPCFSLSRFHRRHEIGFRPAPSLLRSRKPQTNLTFSPHSPSRSPSSLRQDITPGDDVTARAADSDGARVRQTASNGGNNR